MNIKIRRRLDIIDGIIKETTAMIRINNYTMWDYILLEDKFDSVIEVATITFCLRTCIELKENKEVLVNYIKEHHMDEIIRLIGK